MPDNGAMGVPAVILAGGRAKPELAAAMGVDNKALVKLDGRPMVSYVAEALAEAGRIGDRVIVGGSELDSLGLGIPRADDTQNFLGNIKAGMLAHGGHGKILLCSSDVPMITPEMVDRFVESAVSMDADLCYPIIPREDNEARFPGMKRTYVKLKDGCFTGGNMMLINADFLLRNETIVSSAYEARKKPLKLAALLGFQLIVSLICGRATIQLAEETASRMLSGKLRAVIVHDPEIGADVDKPDDIAPAEKYLRKFAQSV